MPHLLPLCLYPADDLSSSSPEPSWAWGDASKAEMGLFIFSNEVGGIAGVLATPVPPPVSVAVSGTDKPAIGGTLAVIAQVSISGYLSAWGLAPILNPFIRADVLARLVVRTHQDRGRGD